MSRPKISRRFLLISVTLLASAVIAAAGAWFWLQRSTVQLTELLRSDRPPAEAVQVQPVSIAGVQRKAIIAGAPRQLTAHRVPVAAGARLKLGLGIEEDVWNLDGDGVLFRVRARQGRKEKVLYTRYVDAKNDSRNRRWIEADIPIARMLHISSAQPTPIDLIFSTEHGMRGDDEHDAAVWADPRITRESPFSWTRAEPPRRPNVLLLSIDTLRADHVGAFGYQRPTTPAIDEIAAKGFLFHRAHAPANHTLESHMSVLTGLYSTNHGVRRVRGNNRPNRIRKLANHRTTLAEVLQGHGYATAGFVYDCLWLSPRFGFGDGFDHYAHRRYPARRLNDEDVFPWLDAHHADPFFIFVHYYDVHSDWERLPYDAPLRFRSKFVNSDDAVLEPCAGSVCATTRLVNLDKARQVVPDDQLAYLRSLYDAGVAATDYQVSRLIGKLQSLQVLDDTLVVIMADHGEEFREHGRFIHAQHYQETLRVPLIFRMPATDGAGGESHHPVQLIDVAPTILDLLGLVYEDPIQGRSLTPLMRGAELAPRPLLFFGPTTKGIIDWPWKLLEKRRGAELYNLERDPLEKNDSSTDEADRVEHLRQVLAQMESTAPPEEVPSKHRNRPASDVGESELERLRALGYLQ